ncbi:MAG: hypothetical protein ABJB76_05180 [Candidatus Nitrosocosmicus sp.]
MPTSINSFSDFNHERVEGNCFKRFFKYHLKLKSSNKEIKLKANRKINLFCIEFLNRPVDKVLPTRINRSMEVH